MEEQEWQPVRLNPVKGLIPEHTVAPIDMRTEDIGKIVRVRPLPDFHFWFCPSGRTYELHPDDGPIVGHDPGSGQYAYCEHQIQAD